MWREKREREREKRKERRKKKKSEEKDGLFCARGDNCLKNSDKN